MKSSRGLVWLPVLLVILGVLAVSGGAYWYEQQKTSSIEKTTEWKIHVYEPLSISFQYPGDWIIGSSEFNDNVVTVTAPSPIGKADSDVPVNDVSFSNLNCKAHDWEVGFGFAEYKEVCPQGVRVILVAVSPEFKKIEEQMLSTLIIKSPMMTNDTAGWKTYTNTQYGFSLRYPTDKVRAIEASDNRNNEIVYLGLTSHPAFGNSLDELTVSVNTYKDCSIYETTGSGYEFIKKVQLGTEKFSQTDVSVDYNSMNSRGWHILAYCFQKNGIVYEIRDRTGGTNPIIQQVLQTLKLISASTAVISVPGMSKYTDANFGFSFWYPSNWVVKKEVIPSQNPYSDPGAKIVKKLIVTRDGITDGITILEYSSPNRSVTPSVPSYASESLNSRCNGKGQCTNPVGCYFDTASHTWMDAYPYGTVDISNGSAYYVDPPGTTRTANVSYNTMGGLHRLGCGIPLSATKFLVLDTRYQFGAALQEIGFKVYETLVNTINATGPSVATPVSTADQIKIIQAEKDEYKSEDVLIDDDIATRSLVISVYMTNAGTIYSNDPLPVSWLAKYVVTSPVLRIENAWRREQIFYSGGLSFGNKATEVEKVPSGSTSAGNLPENLHLPDGYYIIEVCDMGRINQYNRPNCGSSDSFKVTATTTPYNPYNPR